VDKELKTRGIVTRGNTTRIRTKTRRTTSLIRSQFHILRGFFLLRHYVEGHFQWLDDDMHWLWRRLARQHR
jgi:hypothetical protein